MKLLKLTSVLILVTYTAALPQPDTNIQIQHYDGPVYLSTPPNCCPFCNSIIKPQEVDKDNCEPEPEIIYPQPCETEPYEINAKEDKGNDKTLGMFNFRTPKDFRSMLHTDKSIHNIPVTSKPYTGTGIGKLGTDIFGCKPLSNLMPINTVTQNTCQVPMLTYGKSNGDEPVLVPQKFMYSLILDGDVGSNPNGDSRLFYY